MKSLLTLLLIAPLIALSQIEEGIPSIDNQIDSVQARIDSIEQARISEIQKSIYQANVETTVKKLMLGLGEVDVSKDTLQTMVSRDQKGNYYIHLSDYTFKVHEARMLLTIPDKNREALKVIDRNASVIEVLKLYNNPETYIDGKPMPNYKIIINSPSISE